MRLNLDGNRQRELAAWMWNNGGAQMTAAIAFGVVVLAVIVSAQPGSILKDLIAGFGAAGQVFFAGMVWKLSQRQFSFTKTLADKQHRIDLLPSREKSVQSLRSLYKSLSHNEISQDALDAAMDLKFQITPLFSQNISSHFDRFIRQMLENRDLIQAYGIAERSRRSHDEMKSIMDLRVAKAVEMNTQWHAINALMDAEMKVV